MYPGYAQAFRSDIVNLGSIAAQLTQLKFSVSNASMGTEEVKATNNMLGVAMYIFREHTPAPDVDDYPFRLAKDLNLNPDDIFKIGDVDFVRLSALDGELFDALVANTLLIQSNNRMDLQLGIGMDPDAEGVYTTGKVDALKPNDDSLSQKTNATLTIDLLWDQFNAGMNYTGLTNTLKEQNR
jgi:hypothetical protein